MAAEPITSLVDQEIAPGPDVASESALTDYVLRHTGIAYHPVGTCRMGMDGDGIDPDLRVRGVDNLWSAAASIIPDLVSGNTNAVCTMIGEKLGRALAVNSH